MMDLDPDRRLVLAYVPAPVRRALDALWRLDVTFASVLATGRDAMVGRIRLAWWREALESLDRAAAPPEPLLRALQALVLPAGVTGAELAAMEAGWAVLLSDQPLVRDELDAYASARGGRLFDLSARLLGGPGEAAAPAGAAWALVDLSRHSTDPAERKAALEAAAALPQVPAWPRALRPLGMLAMLARRDMRRGPDSWEAPGTPGRMLRMLRHRLTGH